MKSLTISLKILKYHKIKTVFTLIIIAIAMNFPISIIALMDNAIDSSYRSFSITGIDDVIVRYDELVPTAEAITELNDSTEGLVSKIEPRIVSNCIISNSTYNLHTHSTIYYASSNDTWFQGLILEEGQVPTTRFQIVIGRDMANQFNLSIGKNINITDAQVNLSCVFEISGIVHEIGRPQSRYVISALDILESQYREQTNYVGLKLNISPSYSAAYYEELSIQIADNIETNVSNADAFALKTVAFSPIRNSIEASRLFLFIVFCFSLLAAGSAAFSLVTVNFRESIHELGLLKTIGFSNRDISRIFLWSPIVIGIASGFLTLMLLQPISILLQPLTEGITQFVFLTGVSSEMINLLSLSGSGLYTSSIQSMTIPLLVGFIVVVLGGWLPVFHSRNMTPQESITQSGTQPHFSKLGFRRRGMILILMVLVQIVFLVRLPISEVSLAESINGVEIMTALFFLSLLSFFWFILYCIPPFLNRFRLPRFFGGDISSIAAKSLRATLHQYNSTVIAIAVTVLVILLSSTSLNVVLFTSVQNAYAENGSDLLVTGSHDFEFVTDLNELEEVRSVSQILSPGPLDTYVDAVNAIHDAGQILSLFSRNASELSETIHWTSLTRNLEQSYAQLDEGNGIILTTSLSNYLDKNVGEYVQFNLSIGEGEEKNYVYSSTYQILAVSDYLPGIPINNPLCLLSTQNLENLSILRGDRVLVSLWDPNQYDATLGFIQSLQMNLDIDITQLEIQRLEEMTQVIASIFYFMGTVSIITLTTILFSLLVSRVLARKYEYGIIRVIGFTTRQTLFIILLEGLLVGIVGFACGLIAYIWTCIPSMLSFLFGANMNSPLYLPVIHIPFVDIISVFVLISASSLTSSVLALLTIRNKTITNLVSNEIY